MINHLFIKTELDWEGFQLPLFLIQKIAASGLLFLKYSVAVTLYHITPESGCKIFFFFLRYPNCPVNCLLFMKVLPLGEDVITINFYLPSDKYILRVWPGKIDPITKVV